ncbi:MAG: hypothetical protein KUG81_02015 [Gammaproteobacteria bacterium]|nr:hypothetical protein [Gammaproteobacteria bacterium]
MFKLLKFTTVIIFFGVITGCAGLGNMKEVAFEEEIESDMAMVNIVRRRVFLGDGAKVEVWDGDKFIGTLEAGKLLQYKTTPKTHTFMVYVQGSWGVAKGDLKEGKTYYLKFNQGFGAVNLGVAKHDDPRIREWSTMTTVAVDNTLQKKVPQKYIDSARQTLKRVSDGNAIVTPIYDSNAL